MREKFGNAQGLTLIEQIVSLLLGAVVINSLYGFYRAQLFTLLVQETKTASLEDARGALDIMVRDLKNAGSWGKGSAPPEQGGGDDPDGDADLVCNRVYAATAKLIHVQMDLNDNGTCADLNPRENIRYELTAPTSTCPGPNIIRRNGDCLVASVVTPVPVKLFTFYDEKNLDLGDFPTPSAIKRIKITFSVKLKNPDPRIGGDLASTVSTSVDLRN